MMDSLKGKSLMANICAALTRGLPDDEILKEITHAWSLEALSDSSMNIYIYIYIY